MGPNKTGSIRFNIQFILVKTGYASTEIGHVEELRLQEEGTPPLKVNVDKPKFNTHNLIFTVHQDEATTSFNAYSKQHMCWLHESDSLVSLYSQPIC